VTYIIKFYITVQIFRYIYYNLTSINIIIFLHFNKLPSINFNENSFYTYIFHCSINNILNVWIKLQLKIISTQYLYIMLRHIRLVK